MRHMTESYFGIELYNDMTDESTFFAFDDLGKMPMVEGMIYEYIDGEKDEECREIILNSLYVICRVYNECDSDIFEIDSQDIVVNCFGNSAHLFLQKKIKARF